MAADSPTGDPPGLGPSRRQPVPSSTGESVLVEAERVANDADDCEEMRVVREELDELAP
jgi:hypothetical protein